MGSGWHSKECLPSTPDKPWSGPPWHRPKSLSEIQPTWPPNWLEAKTGTSDSPIVHDKRKGSYSSICRSLKGSQKYVCVGGGEEREKNNNRWGEEAGTSKPAPSPARKDCLLWTLKSQSWGTATQAHPMRGRGALLTSWNEGTRLKHTHFSVPVKILNSKYACKVSLSPACCVCSDNRRGEITEQASQRCELLLSRSARVGAGLLTLALFWDPRQKKETSSGLTV